MSLLQLYKRRGVLYFYAVVKLLKSSLGGGTLNSGVNVDRACPSG